MVENALAFVGIISFIIGIAMLLLSIKYNINQWTFNFSLILSIILVSVGVYLVFVTIPWYIIMKKFIGFLIFALGFFLVFLYPAPTDYQSDEFTLLGVLAGIVFIGIGLYMLLF